MKIKLIRFDSNHAKDEKEFYGVENGVVYEVMRQYESCWVSVKTPSGKKLPLFTFEF